ncbi:hypothetical protein [Variovorax sp. LG9.2]|uniref:hypothetical protein n=1 Tax=Variovorax sp. LG9.2 TaxID=3048626 RepID=UPI002B2281AF|nr:hypothetical protein [Variovorax sp. LG9.2]MEB0057319.1 hypothetical protein [Variovorax sp. LG9.2]
MADNYDYLSQQQALAYRLAQAKQLQSAPIAQEGQMVSGRYVSASPLGQWGGALQQALGGYLAGKAQGDQIALDKQDAQQYNEGFAKLLKAHDPSNYTDAATAAVPDAPNRYLYQNPNDVGPPMSASGLDPAATSTPVPQAQVTPTAPTQATPTPLAPVAPVAPQAPMLPRAMAQNQPPVQPTPQQIEAQVTPAGNPQDGGAVFGMYPRAGSALGSYANDAKIRTGYQMTGPNTAQQVQPLTPSVLTGERMDATTDPRSLTFGGSNTAPPIDPSATPVPPSALPQALAAAQPPVAPATPAAQPANAVTPPTAPAVAGTPSANYAGFNEVPPTTADAATASAGQALFLKNAMSADQLAGMAQLNGTKNGQLLVRAVQAKQLEDQLVGNNGRYKTTTIADPINGGFMQSTEDSRTGRVSNTPLNVSGASKVLETKDTPTGVFERTAQGWRPAVDTSTGKPVISTATATDQRATTEAGTKLDTAVASNTTALASMSAAQARLDRIDQLFKTTWTGPIVGHLFNWTKDRQELQALLAQDIFGETRSAVQSAGDAGAAPKFTGREFQYMEKNGGLNLNTGAPAAANIIAQQRIALNGMQTATQQFGRSLAQRAQTNTPSGNNAAPGMPIAAPPRGQTFHGPNANAASALGLN